MALQPKVVPVSQTAVANVEEVKQVSLNDEITSLAKEYGVSAVLAKRIMGCETLGNPNATPDPSKYRLNKTSNGTVWSTDYGYWQINSYFWDSFFKKMGLNIRNPDDNLKAGFWILQHKGSQPWLWSKKCWQTNK